MVCGNGRFGAKVRSKTEKRRLFVYCPCLSSLFVVAVGTEGQTADDEARQRRKTMIGPLSFFFVFILCLRCRIGREDSQNGRQWRKAKSDDKA